MESTDSTPAPPTTTPAPVPTFHERIASAIKTYLADKDPAQTPHHVAYQDLFPEQVMPGLFEQIFDDVVTGLAKAQ